MTKAKTIAEEHSLIKRFKESGKLELLGELYKPYMDLVYGLCLKYFKNTDQAQDAVMGIFEELITKLPKYEIENFKSWLYVLAKNHCLMALRSAKKQMNVSIENFPVEDMESAYTLHHTDEEVFEPEKNIDKLNDCLQRLKNEQKQCITLFYLEKRSYQEIVEISGFNILKVKSYLQNGKRNLKQCIEKSE